MLSKRNNQTVSNSTWDTYRVSVDAIEAATGLNLLSCVSTSVQNIKEASELFFEEGSASDIKSPYFTITFSDKVYA